MTYRGHNIDDKSNDKGKGLFNLSKFCDKNKVQRKKERKKERNSTRHVLSLTRLVRRSSSKKETKDTGTEEPQPKLHIIYTPRETS